MLEDKHYTPNQCLLNVVITYWFAWQLRSAGGRVRTTPPHERQRYSYRCKTHVIIDRKAIVCQNLQTDVTLKRRGLGICLFYLNYKCLSRPKLDPNPVSLRVTSFPLLLINMFSSQASI